MRSPAAFRDSVSARDATVAASRQRDVRSRGLRGIVATPRHDTLRVQIKRLGLSRSGKMGRGLGFFRVDHGPGGLTRMGVWVVPPLSHLRFARVIPSRRAGPDGVRLPRGIPRCSVDRSFGQIQLQLRMRKFWRGGAPARARRMSRLKRLRAG